MMKRRSLKKRHHNKHHHHYYQSEMIRIVLTKPPIHLDIDDIKGKNENFFLLNFNFSKNLIKSYRLSWNHHHSNGMHSTIFDLMGL